MPKPPAAMWRKGRPGAQTGRDLCGLPRRGPAFRRRVSTPARQLRSILRRAPRWRAASASPAPAPEISWQLRSRLPPETRALAAARRRRSGRRTRRRERRRDPVAGWPARQPAARVASIARTSAPLDLVNVPSCWALQLIAGDAGQCSMDGSAGGLACQIQLTGVSADAEALQRVHVAVRARFEVAGNEAGASPPVIERNAHFVVARRQCADVDFPT